MKKAIMLGLTLLVLTASSALALPWTQNFTQTSVEPFNLVEGFMIVGHGFSGGALGNLSDAAWQSDMPNERYVRAWGGESNYLNWDATFTDRTYMDIVWFFYNSADLGNNPPDGLVPLLTYETIYNPAIPPQLGSQWQMVSSGGSLNDWPNLVDTDWMAMWNESSETMDRSGWTNPTSQPDPAAPVPEPSTIFLLGLGLASLAVYTKRRQVAQRI